MDPFEQLASWPAGGAVAVVDRAGVVAAAGPSTPFPWASVTKPLSAYATLRAVQGGFLELDEPAGPAGSTVSHLLAHASGMAIEGDAILAAVGRRRVYSNRGFELLGEVVCSIIGREFGEWVGAEVLEPLGMNATSWGGNAAHGVTSPIGDLALFARELLRPTIIEPALLAEATHVAFPGILGVLPGFGRQDPNDWGLGFEIKGHKQPHWTGSTNSPRTFGHFGQSGSFLWVDPDAELACVCLTGHPFGAWAAKGWPVLSDAVLTAFSRA